VETGRRAGQAGKSNKGAWGMSIKAVSVRAVLVALLAGAGGVCWTAGQLQARLADANGRMVMLQYDGSLGEYDDIEHSLGYLGRFPARATRMAAAVDQGRATALYWDKRYGALSLARDASGQLVETNPDILFLAANALYRAGRRPEADRAAIVGALDVAIATYADVLRRAPGHVDAAYNYEYAVRARDAAARRGDAPRGRTSGGDRPRVADDGSARQHDLPPGPTMHGRPGAPPPDQENSRFKVLVPTQPEERQGNPDQAGHGSRRVRKG
jgi:hypothetical protein